MGAAGLTEQDFAQLLRLTSFYHREAERCRESKSYLAGCVMIAAALEASLLAMSDAYYDEIPDKPHHTGKQPKPLLSWSLAELLGVARRCRWLPAGLDLTDEWDESRAAIGDYAEVVRQVRNLVHPGRYVADWSRRKVTKKHLELCFEVLWVASDYLYSKLRDSIAASEVPPEDAI